MKESVKDWSILIGVVLITIPFSIIGLIAKFVWVGLKNGFCLMDYEN